MQGADSDRTQHYDARDDSPGGPLSGQIALVTGAAAGIARAAAVELARRGARLVLLDVNEDGAHSVADEISAMGSDATVFGCDVTNPDQVDATFARALRQAGRLDALVCTAGGPARGGPLWDVTPTDWQAAIELNMTSAYLCCRAALPTMIGQGVGSVVLATSDQAIHPLAGRATYAAVKAGVMGLTRGLAMDAGPHGIRVNAVAPGPTLTERTRGMTTTEGLAQLAARHALGRIGVPEDIAGVIAFLAGPDSRHITGQMIHVSGGLLMV